VGKRRWSAAAVAARQAFQESAAKWRQGRRYDHYLPTVW